MSSFRGEVGERWHLSVAVDAMRDAARAAGRPGLIWAAGIAYPTLALGTEFAWRHRGDFGAQDLFAAALFGSAGAFVLLLPITCRLAAGLARICAPRSFDERSAAGQAPGFRAAWRAGRGFTLSTLALWILLGALARAAVITAFARAGSADAAGWLTGAGTGALPWVLLAGPLAALLAVYTAAVSVLHQLALQSLVRNRRGVSSAMQHAWRIARSDAFATARAAAVDAVLFLSVSLLGGAWVLAARLLGADGFGTVGALALWGFAGVTRASYWARAFRGLGGLSPGDGAPGLERT